VDWAKLLWEYVSLLLSKMTPDTQHLLLHHFPTSGTWRICTRSSLQMLRRDLASCLAYALDQGIKKLCDEWTFSKATDTTWFASAEERCLVHNIITCSKDHLGAPPLLPYFLHFVAFHVTSPTASIRSLTIPRYLPHSIFFLSLCISPSLRR
jgi:hypothetical protein